MCNIQNLDVFNWWGDTVCQFRPRPSDHPTYNSPLNISILYGLHQTLQFWADCSTTFRRACNVDFERLDGFNLDSASENGHVCVLKWWLKSKGIELKWTEQSMDYASQGVHVNVLNWWKNSGLDKNGE
ncbi:hypothetical protein BJ742DRAFT_791317 [Cladochytrium replicatum]|nr:hypothetical protein BJ742DRAFT_791317 [Cladochytrium replicatum]